MRAIARLVAGLGGIGMSLAAVGHMAAARLDFRLEPPLRGDMPLVVAAEAFPGCVDPVLEVTVVPDHDPATPTTPVFGSAERIGSKLLFRPSFPFLAGIRYRAGIVCPGQSSPGSSWSEEFELPVLRTARKVEVMDIFPSASELPANTLRFYIVFRSDMRSKFKRGDVSLRNGSGDEVRGAFISFGAELWSADGRRLTLLVDPARIKRGVTANAAVGMPLEPGRRYVLSVQGRGPGGKTPSMRALGFIVGKPEMRSIDPARWKVVAPLSATRTPLVVGFDRVMDHALVADSIEVFDSMGTLVTGTLQIENNERIVKFVPDRVWRSGQYHLHFRPELEDVCGNRVDEALDHVVGEAPDSHTRTLAFQVTEPHATRLRVKWKLRGQRHLGCL